MILNNGNKFTKEWIFLIKFRKMIKYVKIINIKIYRESILTIKKQFHDKWHNII